MASIEDFTEEIKLTDPEEKERGKERLFVVLLVILSASAAFGLGRLTSSNGQGSGLTIGHFETLPGATTPEASQNTLQAAVVTPSTATAAKSPVPTPSGSGSTAHVVFASKNGTKYYFPSCKSGNRVLEANKIWFGSTKEAESFGFTLAANCHP